MKRILAVGLLMAFACGHRVVLAQNSTATAVAVDELSEPTRVTLRIDNLHAVDGVGRLAKAAGLELSDVPPDVADALRGKTVTASFEAEPLLPALKELCRQAKIEPLILRLPDGRATLSLRIPRPTPMDVAFARGPAPPNSLCPSASVGPVLVTLVAASTSASWVPKASEQPRGRVSFDFIVLAEPKLDLVAMMPLAQADAVKDEHAGPMPVSDRGMPGYNDTSGEQQAFSIHLSLPDREVHKVSLLQATLRARIAKRRESLSVPAVLDGPERAGPVERALAGVRLRIEPLVKRGDEFELTYTLSRDTMPTAMWQSLTSDPSARGPQLVDQDGLPLFQRANREPHRANNEITVVRRLGRTSTVADQSKRGEPTRMVWSVPVETEEIEIPFEFRDLPVPR